MKIFLLFFPVSMVFMAPNILEAQNHRITEQTLQRVYAINQDQHDAGFVDQVRSADLINGAIRVYVQCGHEGITTIKVITYKGGQVSKRETFANTSDLEVVYPTGKYPDLVAIVNKLADDAYRQHIARVAWRIILDQKRASLTRDVEEFVPWEELSYFILDEANAKKAGKNTDGYDQILRVLTDQDVSNQAVYEFMCQFDLDPFQVARYLTNTHFHALLQME